MKKITYILVFLMVIPFFSNAQRWKHERLSAYAGFGTNFFFGELGGGEKDASHYFSLRDINWTSTRPVIQVGVRYRLIKDLAVKPTFSYAFLKGDDINSKNLARKARNLEFRTHLFELGAQFEYYFLKEKSLGRYTFSSYSALNRFSAYFALGGGAFYYNPKAETVRGSKNWVALRPMQNEGKAYGPIAGYMSVALGAKFILTDKISIGIDISNRYTTTDFLDDASDRYSGAQNRFADRHLVYDSDKGEVLNEYAPFYSAGQKYRGNPAYKDAYLFTLITGYYKLNSVFSMPKY